MKTIIIPTDFSPVATNAMHYGLEMARSVNASLLLFHAYQVPVSYSDVPIILVSVDELKKSAEERLETLKKEVEHISSCLLYTSDAADERSSVDLGGRRIIKQTT